jgi:hypothetical protein
MGNDFQLPEEDDQAADQSQDHGGDGERARRKGSIRVLRHQEAHYTSRDFLMKSLQKINPAGSIHFFIQD